ncbi:MAG: MacB family efflux pump subunit [Porticoccaceae bacterium]|nr:MacB family efflux pump subunit [Porticoccaceae bacterium]
MNQQTNPLGGNSLSESGAAVLAPPLLELRGIAKHYRSGGETIRALDNIDLTIKRGEYIAIMGQSGSGKSTLMHVLGCLDTPSEGEYRVAGEDVSGFDADQLARVRRNFFGFVFQRYNLLGTGTALENVEIPAIYAGAPRAERSARAAQLLQRLGLGERLGHTPGQLSGGQQQRVSIARALMNEAPVILADEPTGALDSRSGEEVLELLDELHRQGVTVILITHDAQVAARARRVIQISDGRIVSDSGSDPVDAVPVSSDSTARDGQLRFGAALEEAVHMALRSLRANLFRSVLTLLGVVIGVAAVVALMALGEGSKQQVLNSIEAQGTNLLTVRPPPGRMRDGSENATMTREDALALVGLPHVVEVVSERRSSGNLRFGSRDYRTEINGVDEGYSRARDWPMAAGTFFSEDDVARYTSVMVLGQTVVDNLFEPGQNPIGSYVLVQNALFQVIGVLAAKGAGSWGNDMDDVALVPVTTGALRLYGGTHLSNITVKVDSSDNVTMAEQLMMEQLASRRPGEEFSVRNTASLLETVSATQNTMALLLGSVAAISLLVGGIGVMNIMLVSVTERTREIGVRMATGARGRDILLQFNIEAVVVCCIGGLLGIACGVAIANGLGYIGQAAVFTPMPSVLAFGCALATGLIFGYLPARKAARLDPVTALAAE